MSARQVVLAHLALALAGCGVNPFTLPAEGDGDAGLVALRDAASDGDGGGARPDARPRADAAPDVDACIPEAERCNGGDDDCDRSIDEDFDTDNDPNNCGACGNACRYDFAFGLCALGACQRGSCFPGHVDVNGDTADGCEYFCIPTAGGVEQCDRVDNDCDGEVDEGFDLATDTANCGACGHECNLLHASAACAAGACEVVACDPGFVDANPSVPGCELFCTPTGVEACDGVDNDCDGQTDEGNPGGGAACGTDEGVCTAGVTTCSFGTLFCVGATGGSGERCDDLDNDCDGQTDEGFDTANNPLACGPSCAVCSYPQGIAACSGGRCRLAGCTFGAHDIDGDADNGCEYACITTGAELCDRADNDCDGLIDEDFDLTSDVSNCGACGNTCRYSHASAVCTASRCELGGCAPNFYDIDGDPSNGCEYGCARAGAEVCNGVDDDCDGDVDEGDPGAGVACGSGVGSCEPGTTDCVGGRVVCVGGVGPQAEVCDFADNDCDGTIDDGFDRQRDPRFCGDCTPCRLANAIAGCAAGACTVVACRAGFVDLDRNPANGCELACTRSGVEVCDGEDNDCDGTTDEAPPPPNFCRTAGECRGATVVCRGRDGWACNYDDLVARGAAIELDGDGDLALEETVCDERDNDCDGGADEPFLLKGTACAEDGSFGTDRRLGACRGAGRLICAADGSQLRCAITTPGAAPRNELCNGADDDCDGHVDEPWDAVGFTGVRDSVVGPVTVADNPIVVYRYEASRADASAASAGVRAARACSAAGRLPWRNVTLDEAASACTAAGMRLCRVTRSGAGVVTGDEWGRLCAGTGDRTYPYGATYAPTACNGSDFDPVAGGVNEDAPVPTGSLPGCRSSDGAFDLSGNVKEWVDDPRVASGQTVYTLRGGSYDNHEAGLTCGFEFSVATPTFRFPNVGFRCCSRSCPPGLTDCNGVCVDLGASEASCGACGAACGPGESCENGLCCPAGTELCADQCVAVGSCAR